MRPRVLNKRLHATNLQQLLECRAFLSQALALLETRQPDHQQPVALALAGIAGSRAKAGQAKKIH